MSLDWASVENMDEPRVENTVEEKSDNASVTKEEPTIISMSSLEALVQPTDLASDELIAKLLQDEFNVEYEQSKSI